MSLAFANMNRTCDGCMKYLSVKPLHKYANGEIKCGRCALTNDGGSAVWFANIPDNALFRCINHYEGCRSFLNHWDVTEHEKNCRTVSRFHCPLCKLKENKYSSLLLLHHLKSDHKDSILNEPKLGILLSSIERRNNFVYYTEEFIFVIHVCILPVANSIEISIEPILTSGIDFCEISTQVQITSTEPKIEINLDPSMTLKNLKSFKLLYSDVQKCRSIELKFRISVNTKLFSPDFIVQQNLRHHSRLAKSNKFETDMELSGCRTVLIRPSGNIPIFCSLCKVPFYGKDIYKCETNKHFICSACRHFDIEECEDGRTLFKATKEQNLLMGWFYSCRWNCADSPVVFSFLNCQEMECENQPRRKCPVSSCDLYGTLRKIFVHYQATHSFDNIKLYDYWKTNNAVYVLDNIANNQEWHYYIIPYDLFVRIRCKEVDADYVFTLEICDQSDESLKCCALIKCNGEKGLKVEDSFTVPKNKLGLSMKGKQCMDIRVFLCPTVMQI